MHTTWNWLRNTVAGLIGWLLFGWAWWRVARDGRAVSRTGWMLIALVAIAIAAVVGLWVLHNRRINSRKGPRRAVRPSGPARPRDRLGRLLCVAVADAAQEIEVFLAGDELCEKRIVSRP